MKLPTITQVKRCIEIFMFPIQRHRQLFAFALTMCVIIAFVGNYVGEHTNPFVAVLLPIFDCYVACLFATLLDNVRLGKIISVIAFLLLYAELFTTFFYRSHFNIHVVQLILETNPKESREFISSALSDTSVLYSSVFTILSLLIAFFAYNLSKRRFPLKRYVVFLSFAIIVWSGIRQVSAYTKLSYLASQTDTSEFTSPSRLPHLDTPFVRVAYSLLFNRASSQELNILVQSVANTQSVYSSFRSPLIVLVIGESYNKHHTPLYNKQYRNTTPRLKALLEKGNLIVYDDVVTPYNLTSEVFKNLFTTWDEECSDKWIHHTLMPVVFRRAGYKVHFISNQFVGETNDFWNTVGATIFNHPKLSAEQFDSRNTNTYTYDGELLSELPSVATLTECPTLLIIHLYGQHVNYADRYPAEFNIFDNTDCKIKWGGRNGKETCNQYDNATLYNDFVVDSIFHIVSNVDALLIYLADHGEEVYDWRNQYERTSDMTPEVAHYQYEIPFMFCMTDTFISHHQDIAESVKQNVHRSFISCNLCHMLFSLAGIQTPVYKEEYDLLSPKYNSNIKRVIRNDTDYDEIIKHLNLDD